MMELTINGVSTPFSGAVEISGSLSEIGRRLEFQIIRPGVDYGLQVPNFGLGAAVSVSHKGNEIFYGSVWDRSVDDSTIYQRVLCYDPMVYLSKSDVKNGAFHEKCPEEIAQKLAGEIGIPCGSLATTGVKLNFNARGMSIYDAVKGAYAEATKVTGVRYYLICIGRALNVIVKGQSSGICLSYMEETIPGALLSTNYEETLNDLVSKIVIQDEVKKEETVFYGDTSYGIVQKVYQKENDKSPAQVVQNMVYDIKTTASAQCIGDFSLMSGFSCDVFSKNVTSHFYIDGDTHRYENGVHVTELQLNYKNEGGDKK